MAGRWGSEGGQRSLERSLGDPWERNAETQPNWFFFLCADRLPFFLSLVISPPPLFVLLCHPSSSSLVRLFASPSGFRARSNFFLCPVLICRIFFPIPFGSTTYLLPTLSPVPFSSVLCVKTQPNFFRFFFIIFPGLPYSKKNVLPFLAKDSAAALDRLSKKKTYIKKK